MSEQELDDFVARRCKEEDWKRHQDGACGGPDICDWCWTKMIAEVEKDLNYEEDLS